MIDLKKYRENANAEGVCIEYSKQWDECKSKKQYIDLALSSACVDYLCDSIAKGWGISPEYISEKFSRFINGKYVSLQNGYDSKMYCHYKGDIEADTTIVAVIESDVTIDVPQYCICEIYATGKCRIRLQGDGRCTVICYGEEDDIKITDCGIENYKVLHKKNRDRL